MFDLENLTSKIKENRQIKAILWISKDTFIFFMWLILRIGESNILVDL